MSNRALLITILLMLAGALVIFLVQTNHETPTEKVAGQIDEAVEEVQDEIDDHTTD